MSRAQKVLSTNTQHGFMRKLSQIKLSKNKQAGVLEVLNSYDEIHVTSPGRNIPLDLFLRYYFLKNKNEYDAEGRTQMVEMVYTLMRYKGYLNAISNRKGT